MSQACQKGGKEGLLNLFFFSEKEDNSWKSLPHPCAVGTQEMKPAYV